MADDELSDLLEAEEAEFSKDFPDALPQAGGALWRGAMPPHGTAMIALAVSVVWMSFLHD